MRIEFANTKNEYDLETTLEENGVTLQAVFSDGSTDDISSEAEIVPSLDTVLMGDISKVVGTFSWNKIDAVYKTQENLNYNSNILPLFYSYMGRSSLDSYEEQVSYVCEANQLLLVISFVSCNSANNRVASIDITTTGTTIDSITKNTTIDTIETDDFGYENVSPRDSQITLAMIECNVNDAIIVDTVVADATVDTTGLIILKLNKKMKNLNFGECKYVTYRDAINGSVECTPPDGKYGIQFLFGNIGNTRSHYCSLYDSNTETIEPLYTYDMNYGNASNIVKFYSIENKNNLNANYYTNFPGGGNLCKLYGFFTLN